MKFLTSLGFKFLGLFLIATPFIPITWIFGARKGAEYDLTPYHWSILLLIVFGFSWLLNSMTPENRIARIYEHFVRELRTLPSCRIAFFLFIMGVLLYLISAVAYQHRPHLIDTVVQLFQAEIFAAGRIKANLPQMPEFFMTQHMIFDEGGWYGQYPPGHSALLAIAVLLGMPWLSTVVLTVATAGMLFKFAKKVYDEKTAQLTVLLAVLCPFMLFMGASFMNHVTCLFFISVFLYFFAVWEKDGGGRALFFAGAALGLAFLARPLTAVAISVPFAIVGLHLIWRSKKYLHVVWGVVGGLSTCSFYFIFNKLTTGDPFLAGYLKLWGQSHGLGFHESPWGVMHTPYKGLKNELIDLAILNEYMFEWPIPALLIIGLFFLLQKNLSDWDKRLLLAFLMLPLCYFFYWHRDAFLGPRFMYSSLAMLLPLSARAIYQIFDMLRGKTIQIPGLFRPVRCTHILATALIFSIIYASCLTIPQRFTIYATSLRSLKFDIVAEARKQGIERGVLFIKVTWGNRLIAELRGYGVGASLAQKAYNFVGHCALNTLLWDARDADWPPEKLSAEIQGLLDKDMELSAIRANKDPSLRLEKGVLPTRRCVDQIKYDQSGGHTVYMGSVRGNQPDLQGNFIVVRDLRERNSELLRFYPGYPAYIYRDGGFYPL